MSSSDDDFDVLIVDDTELNRKLFAAMVGKLGFQARQAEDGASSLVAFEQKHPDMVLMDVQMPGMDGFEVVREMRKRCPDWFPILFISANTTNEHVVEGLSSGGDDYLFKPLHFEVFKAKVLTFKERLSMWRELQRQRKILQAYNERTKEEGDAAHEFMRHFTQLNRIKDPLVDFYMKSAEIFSGDLIAFARTPDNRLNLMLADSAGHGLTSALSVIPLTQPFYSMTHKGFELPSIAQSINKHVREYLPLPRYVAAVLVSIDPQHQTIQVWNGGCPTAILMDEASHRVIHTFASKHLPLGVLPPENFSTDIELYQFDEQRYKLMMCSDGALEAVVGYEADIDPIELIDAATARNQGGLFEGVSAVLNDALHGVPPKDDVAVLLATCVSNKQPTSTLVNLAPAQKWTNDLHLEEVVQIGGLVWDFSVTLTPPQLRRLDVVPFLLGIAQQMDSDKSDGKLFMVLSELFNNALDHGLLKLESNLKSGAEGMENYYDTRMARLENLTHGHITIRLARQKINQQSYIDIEFKDTGDGFDYAEFSFSDDPNARTRHGRGILLLASLCKYVSYSGNGSTVMVRVELDN